MKITQKEAFNMALAFRQILDKSLQEHYEECEVPRIYDIIKTCEIKEIIENHYPGVKIYIP